MTKFIAISFLLLLAASCGNPTSSGSSDPFEKVVATHYSNEPVTLEKEITGRCSVKNFDADHSNFLMHLFLNGESTTLAANFFNFFQGNLLSDRNVISRSVYGEKVELVPTIRGNRSYVRAQALDIHFCPEATGYSPETVESAALSSSYYIKKTNEKFKSVIPDVAVAPITLTIAPLIIRSTLGLNQAGETIKNSSYMTDNAVYFPVENTVAFLPMSRTMKESGLQMKFWEVPMVASHEYGHHLFKSIYGIQGSTLGFHSCFSQVEDETDEKQIDLESDLRRVTTNDVLTAINEGFADLISYYSLNESERTVKGLTCLEVTRDVGSPVMINGKPKKFSYALRSSYFSSFPDYAGGCNNPSYQENHVLGAIFAHNADKYLSRLTGHNDEKLRALVSWIKYLKTQHATNMKLEPQEFLENAMKGFFTETAKTLGRQTDNNICKLVENIYPGLNMDQCLF